MILCLTGGLNPHTLNTMNRAPMENHFQSQKAPPRQQLITATFNNHFLPPDFKPSDKDIICGRARENFHHDGNRYFRDLIQQNVGPYLAARTKLEKSEAIAMIVDKVHHNSPLGGFIKKDPTTERWYKIKESEARDKCSHAVRKAVQRLEDTKPKTAARIKREFIALKSAGSQAKESRSCPSVSTGTPSSTSIPKDDKNKQDLPHAVTDSATEKKTDQAKSPPQSPALLLGSAGPGFSTQNALQNANAHFSVAALHSLPPPSSLTNFESASIIAARLLAQSQQYKTTSSSQTYSGLLGFTGTVRPRLSPEDILLDTALRTQKEVQISNELDYARRLALSSINTLAPRPSISALDSFIAKKQQSKHT